MAEAVGLASGLLTLVVFTFDASKSLYEALSSLKSQRQTIKDILVDLEAAYLASLPKIALSRPFLKTDRNRCHFGYSV